MILKDCCKFQEGYVNPTQKKLEYFDGKIKWLRSMDLNNGYVYDTSRTLTEEGFKSAGKSAYLFPKDSIVISKSGTIGQLGIIKNEMCGNRAVINIVVNNNMADLYYIFYLLQYKKTEIINKAVGSIQKNLYISALETVSINHRSLKEQVNIGKALRIVDDKIDLNNKCILKLEQMMKDIYDYWFVQFDFPNEKGKPYKSSGGKMVYNEKLKMEIPQNFKYVDIGNIEKNIITGKTPPTINIENYNGVIPFITISDIRNNIFVYETEQTLSEIGANIQNNKFLPVGSLCVSCIASIGEIGFTTKISQTNQQINSIIFENEYNKEFFYFALKDYFRKSYVAKTGNTFKNMNKHDFSQIKILYSEELVKCFHNAVKAYMDKVRVLYKQNSKLKHYKNFILPLLMNGQVEVK